MPDNIAGYIDRNYVKGQAYRLAGCPVPAVFTGNIDEISEDLLVKAMFVANDGSAVGTFPQEVGGRYLMETVRYGNDMYLQTACDITSGINYSRIYFNGSWTEWKTSDLGTIPNDVQNLRTDVDTIHSSSNNNGLLDKLTLDVRNLDRIDITTPANSGRVTKLENSISGIRTSINNKVQQVTIAQNVTIGTAAEVNGKFQLGTNLVYPTGSTLIGMRVNTPNIAAISGTVYMLCYAENGTRPWINYQKGNGVTFSNIPHSFIFTFYVP